MCGLEEIKLRKTHRSTHCVNGVKTSLCFAINIQYSLRSQTFDNTKIRITGVTSVFLTMYVGAACDLA